MKSDQQHDNFLKLCREADDLLLDQPSQALIATSWLHVLRDHTAFTKKYLNFIQEKSTLFLIASLLKKILFNFFYSILSILKGFTYQSQSNFKFSSNHKNYIFLSHAINEVEFNAEHDFYFGNIPNNLSDTENVGIIYFNWTGKILNHSHHLDGIDRAFLSTQLNFFSESKIFVYQFIESLRVFKKLIFGKVSLTFFLNLYPEILSQQTSNNLRFLIQFNNLLKESRDLKKVFSTFEGHSHERLFFYAAKSVNDDVVTSGFQHAGIFKNQHSLFRPLGKKYDPEEILAIGRFSQKRFMNSYHNSNVIVSGSPKAVNSEKIDKSFDSISVLIIPEGMEYEVKFMLDYTISCLSRFKDVKFLFRLHPLVRNIPSLIKKISTIQGANFIFSNNTLKDDLNTAHFVIYRGSSAVIDALHCRVIPIFLNNINDKSEIDPLYMLDNLECTSPGDLDFLHNINQSTWLKLAEDSSHIFNKANELKIACPNSFRPI